MCANSTRKILVDLVCLDPSVGGNGDYLYSCFKRYNHSNIAMRLQNSFKSIDLIGVTDLSHSCTNLLP